VASFSKTAQSALAYRFNYGRYANDVNLVE